MRHFLVGAALVTIVIGCHESERTAAPGEGVAGSNPTAQVVPPDAAAAAPQPADAAAGAMEGDVTGAYFAMTELPSEFAELDHLLLATIDENAAPAPLNGFLRPKVASAADYVLAQPRMDGRRLTFTTAEVDGVRYAFEGTFEVTGNFPENPPDYETAVLTGTLTKIHNGRNVATTPVRFRYEAGG